jgi:predicted permease
MLTIFITVLPVFLIIAAGYGAMWRGLLSNDAVDALAKFAQKFAIPCLLFLAVARLDMKTYFNVPLFATYYLPAALVFTIGGMVGFVCFKRTPAQSVAVGFTTLFSNMVLLGLPIMERAYGTEALSTNYALASVHVLFCYIIGITCMEVLRADGAGPTAIFRTVTNAIFHNALALGLILGFAFNFSGITMPHTMEAALEMMARSALPVALFALGGVLRRYKLTSNLPEVAAVGIIKLLLFPTLVYIMGTHVFDLPVGVRNSTVIIAAMPPGINTYIFASMYNRATQTAATSVVICTAISVFTITGWLAFLG